MGRHTRRAELFRAKRRRIAGTTTLFAGRNSSRKCQEIAYNHVALTVNPVVLWGEVYVIERQEWGFDKTINYFRLGWNIISR